ncbi:hypothetical protein KAU11_08035 [Candidatus Babeliales bacterium]|nr:hypothetical protein [Candidatus Babeliales bacterium]
MERAASEETRCQYRDCKHVKNGMADYCTHHGGVVADTALQKKAATAYRLNLYQARVNELAIDPNIKNLRGEIGILRLMIEARLNTCKDDYDLMLQSAAIATLVTQANSLVTSCHRIETLTGQLLDKQSLAEFAVQVVEIISEEVDAEKADTIADRILRAMPTGDDVQPGVSRDA